MYPVKQLNHPKMSLRQTHILLCVRLHVSVLTWPSSDLLTNQVNKCWPHVGIPTMFTITNCKNTRVGTL